jgi:hypothetical protein
MTARGRKPNEWKDWHTLWVVIAWFPRQETPKILHNGDSPAVLTHSSKESAQLRAMRLAAEWTKEFGRGIPGPKTRPTARFRVAPLYVGLSTWDDAAESQVLG